MLHQQDDVCLIIDMEGFFPNKYGHARFECRELGYCSWKGDVGRYAFNPRRGYNKLTPVEQKSWLYAHTIHGLSYYPDMKEEEIKVSPKSVVRALYKEFKTEQRSVIAFKGGHIEKDLLLDLNISFLDLERCGCPKFQKLLDILPENTELNPGCGHHKSSWHHCAMKECEAFMIWYKDLMKYV